jgi:hypothetical protein
MSTRLTWLLGLIILIVLGFLMACGSHYSSSSDGLVIVPSQGSAVLQAFSFNLGNGHAAQINTAPAVPGQPTAIMLDPAGAFAYVASSVPCSSGSLSGAVQGLIATYKVNSDGTLAPNGTPPNLTGNPAYPGNFPTCGLSDSTNPNPGNAPAALTVDSTGKFLFVATKLEAVTFTDTSTNPPTKTTATLPGNVRVFSIGSSASLTEISGSPFAVPTMLGSTAPNPLSLAVTPTTFPAHNAACSGSTAPTTEFLYVEDAANDQVWDFGVDTSSGALGNPGNDTSIPGFATGKTPSGVAVDPCNRFVYVANQGDNNVSGYTICNAVSLPNCPVADGSLISVGKAASAGTSPAALAVDPFGNFVYVVNSQSASISGFKISPANGTLTSLSPATVATGSGPVSIAIRSDGAWLFVANNLSGTLSQYSIIPASGALSTLPAITTDNFPWGVAVK